MQSEEGIEYQNLKSLDLSFKNLHSIPTYMFELISLENLNLSHNQLQELSKEITKLKSFLVPIVPDGNAYINIISKINSQI